MKQISSSIDSLRRRYQQLRHQLASLDYISQGSVQDRTRRKGGGSGYQWTRKVAKKTITVALTQQQFAKLKQAVANYKQLRKQLHEMEQLSRKIIFLEAPHPSRRKSLSQKVLGLN